MKLITKEIAHNVAGYAGMADKITQKHIDKLMSTLADSIKTCDVAIAQTERSAEKLRKITNVFMSAYNSQMRLKLIQDILRS